MQRQRNQGVAEGAPHEELHGQVIDVLHVLGVFGAGGADPALNQLVAHRIGGGMQPVNRLSRLGILTHREQQLVGNGPLQSRQVAGGRINIENRGPGGWREGCVHEWGSRVKKLEIKLGAGVGTWPGSARRPAPNPAVGAYRSASPGPRPHACRTVQRRAVARAGRQHR